MEQVHLPAGWWLHDFTGGLLHLPLHASGAANPIQRLSPLLLTDFRVIQANLFLCRQISLFSCSFLGIPCNNRTFKCGNDICFRKQSAKCDGAVDCPDGSDEAGCSEQDYLPSHALYSLLRLPTFHFHPLLGTVSQQKLPQTQGGTVNIDKLNLRWFLKIKTLECILSSLLITFMGQFIHLFIFTFSFYFY